MFNNQITLSETLELAKGENQPEIRIKYELIFRDGHLVDLRLIEGTLIDLLRAHGCSMSFIQKNAERSLKIAKATL